MRTIVVSFQLQPDESAEQGIRRMVRKQIDGALDVLSGKVKATRPQAVHDARKRFKRIRAALRLVRESLGADEYQRENYCFRDAGRPLTEVRDAKILVDTLTKLIKHFSKEVTAKALDQARAALRADERAALKRVLDEEQAFAKVAGILRDAKPRVQKWKLATDGWLACEDGLKKTYRAGHEATALAGLDPSVENLHEWRKQTKYYWHQLEILEPLWPEMLRECANQVHQLSDYLGDDHDLAMLRQRITEDPDRFGGERPVTTIVALIDRRRAELQQRAHFLGRRIYTDSPKTLTERMHGYWQAWRTEIETRDQRKTAT